MAKELTNVVKDEIAKKAFEDYKNGRGYTPPNSEGFISIITSPLLDSKDVREIKKAENDVYAEAYTAISKLNKK